MFSIMYRINPLPQIPSLGSWQRTHQDSEIGPSTVYTLCSMTTTGSWCLSA